MRSAHASRSYPVPAEAHFVGTDRSLAHVGAAAALLGAVLLFVSTLLHPLRSDPNDPLAAFAEYAADSLWVASHLGQFLGFATLGIALLAALQAVDGVALKIMVDRWAAASGEARTLAYEAAFAVRQIEVGLASLVSLLWGFTLTVFGLAILFSTRYPAWLGGVGLLGGLGTVAAGGALAFTGFSAFAMTLSLLASAVFLIWAILVGTLMWRFGTRDASST